MIILACTYVELITMADCDSHDKGETVATSTYVNIVDI